MPAFQCQRAGACRNTASGIARSETVREGACRALRGAHGMEAEARNEKSENADGRGMLRDSGRFRSRGALMRPVRATPRAHAENPMSAAAHTARSQMKDWVSKSCRALGKMPPARSPTRAAARVVDDAAIQIQNALCRPRRVASMENGPARNERNASADEPFSSRRSYREGDSAGEGRASDPGAASPAADSTELMCAERLPRGLALLPESITYTFSFLLTVPSSFQKCRIVHRRCESSRLSRCNAPGIEWHIPCPGRARLVHAVQSSSILKSIFHSIILSRACLQRIIP